MQFCHTHWYIISHLITPLYSNKTANCKYIGGQNWQFCQLCVREKHDCLRNYMDNKDYIGGCQDGSRYGIRGSSSMQTPKHASDGSTLALKPREDVTRSSKRRCQYLHKKDLCPANERSMLKLSMSFKWKVHASISDFSNWLNPL